MTKAQAHDKIHKLMTLAADAGATPEERQNALNRAQTLRKKYGAPARKRKTEAQPMPFDTEQLRKSMDEPITLRFGADSSMTFTPRSALGFLRGLFTGEI